jgi:hypothetical protein
MASTRYFGTLPPFPEWPNEARDKLPPDSRQEQRLSVPAETKGRSEVATNGSEVGFIEQIGGARTGTRLSSERAMRYWLLLFTFQNGAAWRLNLISRLDKRREPLGF